jgi:hypothetical protein
MMIAIILIVLDITIVVNDPQSDADFVLSGTTSFKNISATTGLIELSLPIKCNHCTAKGLRYIKKQLNLGVLLEVSFDVVNAFPVVVEDITLRAYSK